MSQQVEDTPRVLARATDPSTSHDAAAKTVKNLSRVQAAVLSMFESVDFGLTDSELDSLYAARQEHKGWPPVRFETPRKRRSDLTKVGLLIDSNVRRINGFGSPEVVWVLA
jgi:hypothetical protein